MENPFDIITASLSYIKEEQASIKRELKRLAEALTGNDGKRLMPVKEAAQYLGVPVSSIYQLCHKRELAYYRPGKRSYFKQQDLDEYMQRNCMPTFEKMVNDPLPARKNRK